MRVISVSQTRVSAKEDLRMGASDSKLKAENPRPAADSKLGWLTGVFNGDLLLPLRAIHLGISAANEHILSPFAWGYTSIFPLSSKIKPTTKTLQKFYVSTFTTVLRLDLSLDEDVNILSTGIELATRTSSPKYIWLNVSTRHTIEINNHHLDLWNALLSSVWTMYFKAHPAIRYCSTSVLDY